MNRFNRFVVAAFMSAAMLLPAVQAMQIQQFDKMTNDDQAEYVGELIQGAEKVLTDEGKSDLSAQVSHLFTTSVSGADISIGMAEFMRNLARARVTDAKDAEKNPNVQRIEVEDAMAVTLQKNGIELPDSFFTVMKDFKPKHAASAKDSKDKKN